jgi:uncharacterized coiled-coil protein SlyX
MIAVHDQEAEELTQALQGLQATLARVERQLDELTQALQGLREQLTL